MWGSQVEFGRRLGPQSGVRCVASKGCSKSGADETTSWKTARTIHGPTGVPKPDNSCSCTSLPGAIRRQLRMGAVRCNRPHPAPRRRDTRRRLSPHRPRRDPAPTDHHRAARLARPACTSICTCHGDGLGLRHGYGYGNRSSAAQAHQPPPDPVRAPPRPEQPQQWKS